MPKHSKHIAQSELFSEYVSPESKPAAILDIALERTYDSLINAGLTKAEIEEVFRSIKQIIEPESTISANPEELFSANTITIVESLLEKLISHIRHKLGEDQKTVTADFKDQFINEINKHPKLLEVIAEVLKEGRGRSRKNDLQPYKTFVFPSHRLMFTLLALFAGKTEQITFADGKTVSSDTTLKTTVDGYGPRGNEITSTVAFLANNAKVTAIADVTQLLTGQPVPFFTHDSLAVYINKTFGAEGLRHLLGLLIALEETKEKGVIQWEVNSHLEKLGYKIAPNGSYKHEDKINAVTILQLFTNLYLIARRKDGTKEEVKIRKLFSLIGADIEKDREELLKSTVIVRAENWYNSAFITEEDNTPTFTKLLRRVARENHREHPLCIHLYCLFSVFWRMNPERKLNVEALMDWSGIVTNDRKKMKYLRNLENELDYMVVMNYLGSWTNLSYPNLKPSDSPTPMSCIISLQPPSWLLRELSQISADYPLLPFLMNSTNILTIEQLELILERSKMKMKDFALQIGISRQMLNYIRSGKKKMSVTLKENILEQFGHLLKKSIKNDNQNDTSQGLI